MMGTRAQFARTATDLLDERDDVALLWAEISGQYLTRARRDHPDRVVNVGIREQLLVSAAGGMALAGMRPIAHTFASFLIERAFEQIKLDLVHQGVGAVLVGAGGSYDSAGGGRTHQSPGDVALLDTLPEMTIHAPGTSSEVDLALRTAVAGTGVHYVRLTAHTNREAYGDHGNFRILRRGDGPTVVALGPTVDAVLDATRGLDATVLFTTRVRPLDAATLRAVAGPDVVVVEPWLVGTSAHAVSQALADRRHRLLSIGVPRAELRRYGTADDHRRAHGLDAAGIRARIAAWLAPTSSLPAPR